MPPKAAAAAAAPTRLDFSWALSTLVNPEDPTLLPQAFIYLLGLNPSQLPQDIESGVQLLTAIVPYISYNGPDSQLSSSAMRLLGKLVHDARGAMREALHQPASLQALWGVLAEHHAVHPEYVAALAALSAEPSSAEAPLTSRSKAGEGRGHGAKNAPQLPVDPESTLPGPSKYALDAAMAALAALAGSGQEAAQAGLGQLAAREAVPLLTLLRHNSCRIQVMALRLLRQLLRCSPFPAALTAAGGVAALTDLLGSSPYGAVREEVLNGLSYLMAASAPAMQLAVECGLLLQLLHHMLSPSTGVAHTPPPPPPVDAPPPPPPPHESERDDEGGGGAAEEHPPPPPPLDFSRPVASSQDRLQELAVSLMLQLARQHHGACQELLRLGGLQLLTGMLPAPELPELPRPPPSERRPSSGDTIFAALIPGLGAAARAAKAAAEAEAAAPAAPPSPKDAWLPYLCGEAPLPLPPASARVGLSHRLQVALLSLLACLLAEPGVADFWWSVHADARPHLQLMYLLAAEEGGPALQAVMSQAQMTHLSTPQSRRTSRHGRPEPTQPPFPPEVRAAALACLLQLAKHPAWLGLAPFLAGLQAAVRGADGWGPDMVAPMAEMLQRILGARRPPPPAAAAAAAAEPPPAEPAPPPAAPNGLSLEENGLAAEALESGELVEALKKLAVLARKGSDPWATSAVAAALLALPEGALYAPPWPPLPSPPPTPPPPPLPTSQYLWDALGRPVMADGIQLVHL